MKKTAAILLCLMLATPVSRTATTVQASVPSGYEQVSPSANLNFNLDVQGCDTISVTVNGSSIGAIHPPYNVAFSGVSSGTNTVIINYCDWRGRTGSTTNYLITSFRTFPKRLSR